MPFAILWEVSVVSFLSSVLCAISSAWPSAFGALLSEWRLPLLPLLITTNRQPAESAGRPKKLTEL